MAPPTPRAAALAFLLSLFVAPPVGLGFAVFMSVHGSDAWFGRQTTMVCREVCDGCHGPVVRRGGTRVVQGAGRGRSSSLYCQPPTGSLTDAPDIERYRVGSGGEAFFLWGAMVPAFALVWALLFATLRARFLRRVTARRVAQGRHAGGDRRPGRPSCERRDRRAA